MRKLQLFIAAVGFSSSLSCICWGADSTCGVDIVAFEEATSQALQILPVLDGDVDKCFNPGGFNAGAIPKTHQYLQNAQTHYQNYIVELKPFNQSSAAPNTTCTATIDQIRQDIDDIDSSIKENAGNLRKYGFTTSDAVLDDGSYRYPQCNSKTNDNPAGNWSTFYSAMLKMEATIGPAQDDTNDGLDD